MGRFATFIIGGVVGAVAGLLLAPAKGSDTRKQVVEAVQDNVPQANQLQMQLDGIIDNAAKASTTVINTAIDKGTEVKRSVTARAQQVAPAAEQVADANDELRAKIDAARERIAMQVAKNAEALQDAAVDKIPAVVDAAAGVGAAVSGAVESVKNSVAKSEATTPVDTTTQASAAPATPAAEAASAEDAPAKEESDTTKAE
ncbi:MAG: YtxH domain-containing protein [Eggerthellaceae bacterium]|nr:YtxH domain-containing protein [Eggerthellaceae bacterium]